jgi:hypothetical protein
VLRRTNKARPSRRRAVLYAYVRMTASLFRAKTGFFPSYPGQYCGKLKAITLNFYRQK